MVFLKKFPDSSLFDSFGDAVIKQIVSYSLKTPPTFLAIIHTSKKLRKIALQILKEQTLEDFKFFINELKVKKKKQQKKIYLCFLEMFANKQLNLASFEKSAHLFSKFLEVQPFLQKEKRFLQATKKLLINGKISFATSDFLFSEALKEKNVKLVEIILNQNTKRNQHFTVGLPEACRESSKEIVKLLLLNENFNSNDEKYQAIKDASLQGKKEILHLLLQSVEKIPLTILQEAYNCAALFGYRGIKKDLSVYMNKKNSS